MIVYPTPLTDFEITGKNHPYFLLPNFFTGLFHAILPAMSLIIST